MHDKKLFFAILKRMTTSYGKFFLSVTGIFCCLFIGYLCYSSYTLNLSQKRIKDYYINHINKADSLCFSISAYNTVLFENIQKANNALLADSLIKYTLGSKQKLSENQYKDLSTIISNYYNQSIKIQEQYQSKLSRDSLQLNAERTLLEGQTKAMIDLHLTKIDHEYNNITMWAAILTILFLVFSFYSIFKMDELIQQGREGVKDIKRLKKEGENSIIDIKDKNKEQIEELKNNTQKIITDQKERFDKMSFSLEDLQTKLYSQSSEYIDDLKKKAEKQSQQILDEYSKILQEKSKVYDQNAIKQVENIENRLVPILKLKEELEKYLNKIQIEVRNFEDKQSLFSELIDILQDVKIETEDLNKIDFLEKSRAIIKIIDALREYIQKNNFKNKPKNGELQNGY